MAETVSQTTQGAILLTEDMYTKKGVDEQIAAAVKGGITPKGSSAFASLPTPADSNLGWMYNVTDAFETTSAFVGGGGHNSPAGTNIYVANPATNSYKWDVLPGEGPQPASSAPSADGTAAVGTSAKYAREDHVHPTDTTRQAAITATGILKGTGSAVVAATAGTDYVKSVSQATDGVVTVSGSNGQLTVDHAKNGPSSSADTSKGDTTNQTPSFGGSFKVTSATVDKYGHTTALAEHTVTIPSATATASTSGSGGSAGLMSATDKEKLNGISTGANVGITGVTGTNSSSGSVDATHTDLIFTGTNITATADTNNAGILVALAVPDGTTSAKGVVQLSDSTSSDVSTTAATSAAVYAVATRTGAIESAAGTLYTALNGLDATSMTTTNAIKTLVTSLLSYLKAFAAASDNDNSTTYTAS